MTNTVEKINCRAMLTLAEMWNHAKKGLFCDVTLVAALDGKKITAHRSVLSAANDFFQTMFCGEFKEADEKEVIISEISGDILEQLIGYCYTGLIDINEDNAQLILPQASLLLFSDILEPCSKFQISLINPTNCLSMARYAKLYNCKDLLKSAEDCMKKNFVDVAQCAEFLKLSEDELKEYLSLDELNVDSEKDVFQAMMSWINHDLEKRSNALSKLLPVVRLHQIKNYLLEYVLNNYRNEIHFSIIEGIKQNLLNAQTMPVRKGPKPNRFIVVCDKQIQVYNPAENTSEFKCSILSGCVDFIPTLFGEKVIFVSKNKVQCFDLNTETWNDLTSMLTTRSGFSVAILNDFVYAVGGMISLYYLGNIERFDPKLNQWKKVARMNHSRSSHCTAVLHQKLYAIGGYADKTCLNTVECYDPNTNTWTICSPMLKARQYASAIAVNGKMFVCGGRDSNSSTLKCIEKYNPETNAWTKVAEMCCNRYNMGTYLFNDKIYLLGGHSNGGYQLESMEEFDPATNQCKLVSCPEIEFGNCIYCLPYLSKTNY